MDYEIIDVGRYKLLFIEERVDFYNINEFKKLFFDIIEAGTPFVAVEFRDNYGEMSSSILGALVSGQKKVNALGSKLILVNVGETVKNIMGVAGLITYFTFADTIDELNYV